MTGSMLIPNSLGDQTLLILTEDKVTSSSEVDAALPDARAALKKELGNPSGREGNIKFLKAWIRFASVPQTQSLTPIPISVPPITLVASASSIAPTPIPPIPPIPPIITPPNKTSVRLKGEPWEEDNYLKDKGESIAST